MADRPEGIRLTALQPTGRITYYSCGNYFVKVFRGKYKFNLNAKDAAGNTMLITASLRGHLDVVRVLINAEADLNIMNIDHNTALIAAASEGYSEVVRVLINAGADANVRNVYGETAVTVVMAMIQEMRPILRAMRG